ncbi:MAG: YbhB/YbcL family Raf kinase inhibitor-like protein [Nanoarchaeota archaeon]
MQLTSPAFEPNGKIPSRYTCDGENINPPLTITDVPVATKSLVLIMDDPDIPEIAKKNFNVDVWDHWVVFNIPPMIKEITERNNPPGILGKNTRGNNAYGGPCPPDREHRYFFKLYALNTMLNLKEGATKKEVEKAMEGHIIAQIELIGQYERVKS